MSHRSTTRTLTACWGAVAVALAVCAAVPASAVPPQRSPAESGLPFTFDAGLACPFPVSVEEAEPSSLETVDFGGGRTVTVGRLVVRLTNVATGKSIVRDVSGPTHVRGDRTTFSGRSLQPVFPGDHTADLPADRGLFVVRGHVRVEGTVFTRFQGEVEDVCRTLAPTS